MTREQKVFLNILHYALKNKSLGVEESIDWDRLFRLSLEQDVLPLILDTAFCAAKDRASYEAARKKWKMRAVSTAVREIQKVNEFLTLVSHAQKMGLDPVVFKGVVCASLYPKPMLRPSVDADIIVPPDQADSFHSFFLSEGLYADQSKEDMAALPEISYHKTDSPVYIELHKYLFNPGIPAYADLNGFFTGFFARTVRIPVEDISLRTMDPTDHLLFLFLHAFKHFIHSGVGIRPVCDIGLFAQEYHNRIRWDRIRDGLTRAKAFYFSAALLRILQIQLMPEASFYAQIREWELERIDTDLLLRDILDAGIHGNASQSRRHSSNMTLYAVTQYKTGGEQKNPMLHTLFLSVSEMQDHFPYLKKAPVLLPIAWTQRILRYLRDSREGQIKEQDPMESIRIGNDRIRLLEQYRIIRDD